MIAANLNGDKSDAAHDPLAYLFGDTDASGKRRIQTPKLVLGNRTLFKQKLKQLRAAGIKSPFLHVAFNWHLDDIPNLDLKTRNRIPTDYLETLTGRPAVRIPRLIVEHGPGELHLLALKHDLAISRQCDLYVHRRDAVRMRAWAKTQNTFHGWRDPDLIPPPGNGDIDLTVVDPDYHQEATEVHSCIETARADGRVHSRQDVIDLIQRTYACQEIHKDYSGLKITFEGGIVLRLQGKCYSCAYDAEICHAGIRGEELRSNRYLSGRQPPISDCTIGSGIGVGQTGERDSQEPTEGTQSPTICRPQSRKPDAGPDSAARSYVNDPTDAVQPNRGLSSDPASAGAQLLARMHDWRASLSHGFRSDGNSLRAHGSRGPDSGRMEECPGTNSQRPAAGDVGCRADRDSSHNRRRNRGINSLSQACGPATGERSQTQSVVIPRTEELVLQLWDQGYFDRFPSAEEFFAPLASHDLKKELTLPAISSLRETEKPEPPLSNSDVSEISL